jgi:hypothetical protein
VAEAEEYFLRFFHKLNLISARQRSCVMRDDHLRPLHIFKSVRYCVVNILSVPYLVPAVLVPTIRK